MCVWDYCLTGTIPIVVFVAESSGCMKQQLLSVTGIIIIIIITGMSGTQTTFLQKTFMKFGSVKYLH